MQRKSKVKWFDGKKGYGFIVNPDGGEDIFVHFSAIVSDQSFKVLNQDAEVEFEVDQTQKGLQAKNVSEISSGGNVASQPSVQPQAFVRPGESVAGQ
ncbi:MAG: cold shock domain-containing protein [Chlorobiales bacterium]|nr:cold shock domain-containing protein [Chlorobiales bacterium]